MFDSPRDEMPHWAVGASSSGGVRVRPAFGAVEAGPLVRAAGVAAAARDLVVASGSCGDWSASERVRALREVDAAAAALAMVRSRLLVAERDAGTLERPGDRDFAAARVRQARTGLGEARREVRLAEALETMPTVAEALTDGRVPLAHVDSLARTASRAGEAGQAQLASPQTQAELVSLAGRLPLRDFTAAAERLLARWDPVAVEADHAAQRSARFLVLTHQPDGTLLRRRLDRVTGAVLRAALDGVGAAPDAGRSKEQADADALIALVERGVSGAAGVRRTGRPGNGRDRVERERVVAGGGGERVVAGGDGGGVGADGDAEAGAEDGAELTWDVEQQEADARVSGSANRPTVCVLVPASTLAEVVAVQAARVSDDAGATWPSGLDPALLDDGTVLAVSELTRFLCDSELGRLVLGADSVPLDVGRSQRLFTAAQRRAIIVRDRGCAWNGCDVPAAYCEAHHIRWWDRDRGPTDLANGVLLCSYHHHVVHERDLSIVRAGPPGRPDGGFWHEPQRYTFRDRTGRAVNLPPEAESVLGREPGREANPLPAGDPVAERARERAVGREAVGAAAGPGGAGATRLAR